MSSLKKQHLDMHTIMQVNHLHREAEKHPAEPEI